MINITALDPDFVRLNSGHNQVTTRANRSRGITLVLIGLGVVMLMIKFYDHSTMMPALHPLAVMVLTLAAYHGFEIYRLVKDKGFAIAAAAGLCFCSWISLSPYSTYSGATGVLATVIGFLSMVATLFLTSLARRVFRIQQAALSQFRNDNSV